MSNEVKERLVAALNPGAIKVSGKFTAMLSYFLDQDWTKPKIVDMVIDGSGIVMVGTTVDPMMNEIVGEASDLFRNLNGVADAAELSDADKLALIAIAKDHITDWRQS